RAASEAGSPMDRRPLVRRTRAGARRRRVGAGGGAQPKDLSLSPYGRPRRQKKRSPTDRPPFVPCAATSEILRLRAAHTPPTAFPPPPPVRRFAQDDSRRMPDFPPR